MKVVFEENKKEIGFAIIVNVILFVNYAALMVFSLCTFNFFLLIVSIIIVTYSLFVSKPFLKAFKNPQSIEITEEGLFVKPLERVIQFEEIEKVYKENFEIQARNVNLKYYYPVIKLKDKTIIRFKYQLKSQSYYDKLFYLLDDVINSSNKEEISKFISNVKIGFNFSYTLFTNLLIVMILSMFMVFIVGIVIRS